MAKTLWLLRHAKAVQDPPIGARDRDRRLSPRGEEDANQLGMALGELSAKRSLPTLILTSPAVRTRSTAERVFGQQGIPEALIVDQRLYHAAPDDVLEIVRGLDDEADVVCVVGHNPTIQCFSLDLTAEVLLDEPHPGADRYPPGTLSILELPIEHWSEASRGEATLVLFRVPPREH